MKQKNTIGFDVITLDGLDVVVGGADRSPSINQPKSQDSLVADGTQIVKGIGNLLNPFNAPDTTRRVVNSWQKGTKNGYSVKEKFATGLATLFGF